MLSESRLKRLEELLSIGQQNKIVLVIEDDYGFNDKFEEDRFIDEMGRDSLIVEISQANVNKWRQKNEM